LSSPFELTEHDYTRLAASYISREIADEAGIFRVDHHLGASTVGAYPGLGENYAGLIIPFWHPLTGLERERLLRRDEPDRNLQSDGNWKEEKKYVWPHDRTNMLYIPRGITSEMLADAMLPVVLVEGEKKALATLADCARLRHRWQAAFYRHRSSRRLGLAQQEHRERDRPDR
jgi:hypothetical protein